jgi:hypothetical protein
VQRLFRYPHVRGGAPTVECYIQYRGFPTHGMV